MTWKVLDKLVPKKGRKASSRPDAIGARRSAVRKPVGGDRRPLPLPLLFLVLISTGGS